MFPSCDANSRSKRGFWGPGTVTKPGSAYPYLRSDLREDPMRTILAILLAGTMGGGLAGCVVHPHGHGHGHGRVYGHSHSGVEVTVPVGHFHDAHCGHYYHGDRWYHHHHHHHGPGCGHVYVRGRWMLRL